MFEEIIDAVLLHQARYKREIGFAILHAIFQFREIACSRRAKIDLPLIQNFLDDVQGGLVMPNPAVVRACQQPKGRPQYQSVGIKIALHPDCLSFDRDAVEIAFRSLSQFHAHAT